MTTDFIKKIRKNIYDALFPVRCPYCGKVINKTQIACKNCLNMFPEISYRRFASGGYKCCTPFLYRGIFAAAAKRFKFANGGGYSPQLSAVIAKSISECYPDILADIDYVTCVPMHKKQLRQRGYNQAKLLARDCAEILKIPYIDALEKYRENETQHNLRASLREQNVKGVYRVCNKNFVKGKNILLIDDIITTGNTLGECCRVLEKSGCNQVICAALCDAQLR